MNYDDLFYMCGGFEDYCAFKHAHCGVKPTTELPKPEKQEKKKPESKKEKIETNDSDDYYDQMSLNHAMH